MPNLFKVAGFAAICLSLTAVIATDEGKATGAATSTELKSGDIVIDPVMMTKDADGLTGSTAPAIRYESREVLAEIAPASPATDTAFDPDADSLAELVSMQDTGIALDEEGECLAGAIYFESKSESLDGQLAVAKVIMARAESGRFPRTLCGVVYQPSQFSFVKGGQMPPINRGSRDWKDAVAISQIAMRDHWDSPVEGALFFHARRVSPGWKLARMGTVGNHVFYR